MINYKNLEELDAAGSYLVRLLFSVLHEKEAPVLPSELKWELIFDMARMHSVETMAFYGAEPFIKDNPELYQKWKKSRDANTAQSLIQIEARKEVFQALHTAGIRFLPLKGYEMKLLYPRLEFRQMADIDILIDPENTSQVQTIMQSLGYLKKEETFPHHDEYFTPPFVTVEIHRQLLLVGDDRQEYYDNIWDRSLPDEENPGAYKLTPDDFYIYQIAHFAKHYNRMGSGIRSVMDIYIYLEKYREILNREYIEKELQKLDIYDFCVKMESLSLYWFSDSAPKPDIAENELNELERNIFLSGVYGSNEFFRFKNMVSIQTEKGRWHNFRYFWKRIFVSREEFKNFFPVLKKYPVLLPFFYLYRVLYVIRHRQDTIKREIELFRSTRKK